MENLQRATDSITDIRSLIRQAKEVVSKYIKIKQSEDAWDDLREEIQSDYHV